MTKLLDFKKNTVETLTLEELKETAKELNLNDEPMMGIHHYELFDKCSSIIENRGLTFEVENLFAASNNDRSRPGVSVVKSIAEIEGYDSPKAHMLRRIIGRILVKDMETTDLQTAIGISFHQNGFQIAMGDNVKICQNMTILGKNNIIANYKFNGNEKVPLNNMFEVLDDWLANYDDKVKENRAVVEWMNNSFVRRNQVLEFVGKLTELRVKRDKFKDNNIIPLNQSQIGSFTEAWLTKEPGLLTADNTISLWDMYNIGTELHKPGITDFPNILPANYKFGNLVKEYFNYESLN